jgi:hypothetical protein
LTSLFKRKVEVKIGDRTFKSGDFYIEFDVPFDDSDTANVANISIYNLTDKTINTFKKGVSVFINAGYESDNGGIFSGVASPVFSEFKGVDKVVTIDAVDGNDKWVEAEIKKTYKENTTALQILKDLIKMTGLSIGALKLPQNKVYRSGKTFQSKLSTAIIEIARDCGAKMHVNRLKIYIRPKNEGDTVYFVLNKDHGMVGIPSPIEKEETYKVTENIRKETKKGGKTVVTYEEGQVDKKILKRGYNVVSLLNHKFTTDAIIEIRSKTANGRFRIESGKHYCRGNSFYTEMEVFPL